MGAIDNTIGAMVVSSFVGYFANGVVMSMVWKYFSNFRSDPIGFKLAAGAAAAISMWNCIALSCWAYSWGVTNYSNPAILANTPWMFPNSNLSIGTVSAIVQHFYAWRCYKMSSSFSAVTFQDQISRLAVPAFIILTSIAQAGCLYAVAALSFVDESTAALGRINNVGITWASFSITCDFSCTAAMLYHLVWKVRNAGIARDTHSMLRRIAARTIESNIIGLILQSFVLAMFLKGPGFWFMVSDGLLGPAYTGALLVSLTARREVGAQYKSTDFQGSVYAFETNKSGATGGRRFGPTSGVNITIDQRITHDGGEEIGQEAWAMQKTRNNGAVAVKFENTQIDEEKSNRSFGPL